MVEPTPVIMPSQNNDHQKRGLGAALLKVTFQ